MANVRRINLYATNTKRHCDKGKGGADSLPGFGCGDTVDVVLLKKKQMRIWASLIIRVI